MDRKAELYYLDKDKLISMEIVSHKDWHHISVYNDKTDKSVAYETNNKDLKGLADFIYRYLENK
jgi:hypothetical protein